MRLFSFKNTAAKLALLASFALLSACNSDEDVTVSGSVFASPVSAANVTAKDTAGNTLAGPVLTDANGNYSIAIKESDKNRNIVFEATGGSFIDEATGQTTAAGNMSAYSNGGVSSGSTMHLTPGSTVMNQLIIQHSMSYSNAETTFSAAFGYTPDTSIAPTDATNPTAGATTEQLRAGLRAGAFSQLADQLQLTATQQFQLFTALAQDLSDGTLDGEDASGAVNVSGTAINLDAAIQNRFNAALIAFHRGNGSSSGLLNTQIGDIVAGNKAMTSSYVIEYLPGMMAPMEGKSVFKIRITDHSGTAQTGLAVSLMPMMYMESHTHSTPLGTVTDNNDGTYDLEIYYLMGSSMHSMSMGYWEIKVMVGGMMGEMAYFYPDVMAAMGDTARGILKGQMMGTDKVAGMSMDMPRPYTIFNEGVTGTTGSHDVSFFVGARETMMSYPAVNTATVLNAGTSYELTVASITVEVSTDASSWTTATETSDGHYAVTGLSGLTDGVQAEIYVRLTVNGEQKTTDAASATGANGYATFTVTP